MGSLEVRAIAGARPPCRRSLEGLARCSAGLLWLTVAMATRADGSVPVLMAPVSGEAVSGGPTYDFSIGVYEITNDQFAAFLNDARVNLSNERGQYLYFATDTGNVYVHSAQTGAQGLDGGGTPVLDVGANGHIELVAGAYQVDDPIFGNHPVTGVSWYGAAKFCNWMTVASGLSPGQRAYTEAPSGDLAGWHPVTISYADWAVRDLDAAERLALLALLGHRLPMDDESATQNAYNEWYKAAAHDGAGGHWSYGFGRDAVPGGADANYLGSGDPFDDDTTPAGFYGIDGERRWHDEEYGWGYWPPNAFSVFDTDNAYGLYDMSGNVWEWVQDQGGGVDRRAVRGGSRSSSAGALLCRVRATRDAASAVDNTGFRIVQSTPQPLLVVPDVGFAAAGPYGGPYDLPQTDYLVTNVSDATVSYRVESDVDWVTLNGQAALTGQSLDPSLETTVTVAIDAACTSAAVVGLNAATVTVTDDVTQNVIAQRDVDLTVTEPLSITPQADQNASGLVGGPFVPPQIDYTIDNAGDTTIGWEVSSDAVWITLNGQPSLSGTVFGQGQMVVNVGFDAADPELQTAGPHTAQLTFTDTCTAQQFIRSLTLDLSLPMSVTPPDDARFEGPAGGPFQPTSFEYTITNLSDSQLGWQVTAGPPVSWLDIDGGASAGGTLDPQASLIVTAGPSSSAATLSPGAYTTQLTISDTTNGFDLYREVELTVNEFQVTPTTGMYSQGPIGGPFSPVEVTYTITYAGQAEMNWRATYDTGGTGNWLSLNGASQAGGWIIEQGGTADVAVRINSAASSLQPGSYSAAVTFEDLGIPGSVVTRTVDLLVGQGGFAIDMAIVRGNSQDQPGGPIYDFRIGVHEVTNAGFAAFLTSAVNNLDNARGAFMYHDIDTGDVHLNANTSGLGEIGTDGAGTLMFAAGDGGAILYDSLLQSYEVASGMEDLPVVGVSWYGAVKFCNWMTLAQGMDEGLHRAYHEGPTPEDWYPVTTTSPEWLAGDLDASQRSDLVTTIPGFRLVMDDGAGSASAYNEWYKAGAWDPTSGNAVYGFGGDSLAGTDANYAASGDPFETDSPPLSPVGFFDGVNLLADGQTVTADTANAYGLYDMCGNAAEWVQDQGTASPAERATRGGNVFNLVGSAQLLADQRATDLPGMTRNATGFRVAQSLLADPLQVTPGIDLTFGGVVGGPMTTPAWADFTLANSPRSSNEWLVTTGAGWLDVNQLAWAYGVLPPGGSQLVTIALNDAASELSAPGDYTATVIFLDQTTQTTTASQVTLTLDPALAATPETDLAASGPFRGPFSPLTERYTLTNNSDATTTWQVDVDVAWVDLDIDTNGTDPAGLESGEQVFVDVSINTSAEDLAPGLHAATVSFTNPTNGYVQTREVELYVTDAISVTAAGTEAFDLDDHAVLAGCLSGPVGGPLDEYCAEYDFDLDHDVDLADYGVCTWLVVAGEFHVSGLWGGPFETSPAEHSYTIQNLLTIALDYSVAVDVDWITLGGDPLSGTLAAAGPPRDTANFTAAINANADLLAPGGHLGTVTFAFDDQGVGGSRTRTVWLYVDDLLRIVEAAAVQGTYDPPADPVITVPAGGVYTLANLSDSRQVGWQVACDQTWVTIDGGAQASGDLLPLQQTTVTIGLGPEAELFTHGVYTATLTFTDLLSGFATTRGVTLTVTETVGVWPKSGLDAFGTLGGPVSPDQQTYTLTNQTDQPLTWQVAADQTWVQIDIPTGGLDPQAQVDITVSIVTGYAEPSDSATVSFINVTDGNTTAALRQVTVTLTPPFDEQTIPGDDTQPGGPTYSFEMATYEVTNDEFVAFLNDALANPGDERGQYLYFTTDTGNVYLHTAQLGAQGLDFGGTLVLDVAVNGHIVLNAGTYGLDDPSYGNHPVTGVSWYGALKYCNWRTIDEGVGPAERCYNEGPAGDLDEWRPATIAKADWQVRDLDDTERQALVDGYRGFRLPMDDGSGNPNPVVDSADAYNEWYKAAAWDQAAGVNHVFGFGADDLDTNGADANYYNSGDPFDDGPTPVGFFGTNGLRDWDDPQFGWAAAPPSSFAVLDAASAYGLYDMSGNVAEWMQDRFSGLSTRAVRGGSWANEEAQVYWIRTFDRDAVWSPGDTYDTVGFRLLRVAIAPSG